MIGEGVRKWTMTALFKFKINTTQANTSPHSGFNSYNSCFIISSDRQTYSSDTIDVNFTQSTVGKMVKPNTAERPMETLAHGMIVIRWDCSST